MSESRGRHSRWPWPASIPGVGAFLGAQPFAHCALPGCITWTWVRYGALAVCVLHAQMLGGVA